MEHKLCFNYSEDGSYTITQDDRDVNDIELSFNEARTIARILSKEASKLWAWIDEVKNSKV